MKSVMISIRPKWIKLIGSGKKTVEVRKTRPKIEVPFKCYIYGTKGKIRVGETLDKYVGGEVIGEFVCDYIFNYWCGYAGNYGDDCLSYEEQLCYLGENVMGYGWHISRLVIYEKPKYISEFEKPCPYNDECLFCDYYAYGDFYEAPYCMYTPEILTRPPRSWCYVEKLK